MALIHAGSMSSSAWRHPPRARRWRQRQRWPGLEQDGDVAQPGAPRVGGRVAPDTWRRGRCPAWLPARSASRRSALPAGVFARVVHVRGLILTDADTGTEHALHRGLDAGTLGAGDASPAHPQRRGVVAGWLGAGFSPRMVSTWPADSWSSCRQVGHQTFERGQLARVTLRDAGARSP